MQSITLNVHLYTLHFIPSPNSVQAVFQNQVKKCRCHGLTTTCHLKTCSRMMPDAKLIGQVLKKEYKNAQKVEVVRERANLPYELIKVDYESTQSDRQPPFPDHTQLVYQKESPDYCSANSEYGATGVSGRECTLEAYSTNPRRIGHCSKICCEAGWRSERVMVEEVCQCIVNRNSKRLDCSEMCRREDVKYYCN